jgi:hypothetical protein
MTTSNPLDHTNGHRMDLPLEAMFNACGFRLNSRMIYNRTKVYFAKVFDQQTHGMSVLLPSPVYSSYNMPDNLIPFEHCGLI